MAEALEDAIEAKDKHVALLIAILALFLALSEAGGKNAQHRSTEQNIEASDLYNFYQAKKIRASMVESDVAQMEISRQAASDPKVQEAMDKQIAAWKSMISHYETDKKDGTEVLLEPRSRRWAASCRTIGSSTMNMRAACCRSRSCSLRRRSSPASPR
jgi:hypothetical protein